MAPAQPSSPVRYPSSGLSPPSGQRDGEKMAQGDKREPSRVPLPVEEDIMQLSRLGEIGAIQKLFEAGKFDANYKDEQGITPLHWAAIKNHFALCHFLIQSGADVNAKGGDVSATPVLWAARNCNYYVVDLLLQSGADPLKTDDQGFNLIQNATLDGNVYQLLLLLHHDIPVDTPDDKDHTSLMWAAYKGYPACVEVLLQWGASVHAKDEQGFTALHWALVKGSQGCIHKLVEYGSDRFAATSDGKTPAVVAREMSSTTQWHRALADCGYDANGQAKNFPFAFVTNDRLYFISRFFFFWPFLILLCVFYIISGMPVYVGIPLALFTSFALQWVSQQLLQWAPSNMKHIHNTPFMAGVFAGTHFWVGVQWLHRILPQTFASNPFLNILFATSYSLCAYFYFLAISGDPGYVPKSSSRSEQKAIVHELINAGRFDENNFCINCSIRRPLRSKHCRRCGRCVAKQDHHCPWINNCVAINNHRHFLFYILCLEIGIITLIWLTISYLTSLPSSQITECNILGPELCDVLNKDPFTIVTVAWAMLQLTWVTMLLFVQLVQVSRAQTTLENMRGHARLSGPAAVVTSAFVAGTTSLEGAEVTERGIGPDPAARQPHPQKESCFGQWKKLLGVDAFMATAVQGSRADEITARQRANPFTRGFASNCTDFFCDTAPVFGRRESGKAMLGGQVVDYYSMFEPPTRQDAQGYQAIDAEDRV